MATYNTGRVVGWSTYEEFLRENPTVDPAIVSAQVYQTMVTYGASRKVVLPTTGWAGTTILTQTVAVPGAIWGAVPIIGLNYEDNTADEIDSATGKSSLEHAFGNVFSCYVSDGSGTRALNVTSTTGYITFCAYPGVLNTGVGTIPLIVRGLGAEALSDGNYYLGPQGMIFGGNALGLRGAASAYERAIPAGGTPTLLNMDPVVDMRTSDPKNYYQAVHTDAPATMDVSMIEPSSGDAAVLTVHQRVGSLPPALYGTKLAAGEVGPNKLYPIDTTAPGTVKMHQLDGTAQSMIDAMLAINNLESNTPYNYGMYREHDTAVIRAKSPNPIYGAYEPFPPISEDTTVNMNGLMTTATNWIWFYRHDTTGGPPTFEQMQTVGAPLYQEVRSGAVSQRVIDEYGVSYAEYEARKSQFTLGVSLHGGFWDGIPVAERDDWCCILTGPDYWFPKPIKVCSFILVHKSTGAVYSFQSTTYATWNLKPLNFGYEATGSGSGRVYKESLVDFLGTWWGIPENGSYLDADGAAIISHPRHQHIADVAGSQTASFYLPEQLLPRIGEGYTDVRDYFQSVLFSDFVALMGETETSMNLHPDYHGRSLQEILELAAIKNLTLADTPDNRIINLAASTMYLYKPDAWPITGKVLEDLYPTMKVDVPGAKTSQYDMRVWSISERADHLSSWSDTTDLVNRANTHTWVSQGQSGHNKTAAISLIDDKGIRLPLHGTAAEVSANYITWGDLLTCLNMNKKLDILGEVLRGLKTHITDAGDNYIEFNQPTSGGNNLRLYITNGTPPVGARDGDIGIGW